jgi:ubiquinone/menaquinone biosynthesis C-methylase UbiE
MTLETDDSPCSREGGRAESVDERLRTRRFFNLVAPAFHVIDRRLLPEYRQALETLSLDPGLSVLDLATGTGTLAAAFAERGHPVAGIDFAARLLRRARRRLPGADLRLMDLADLPQLPNDAYDVVALAYVLHGMPPQMRRFALCQARRLARRHVLIFDYSGPGRWYVRLIEWIEGPHYPSFVDRPMADLAAEAGLIVEREERTSSTGACWLLGHGDGSSP